MTHKKPNEAISSAERQTAPDATFTARDGMQFGPTDDHPEGIFHISGAIFCDDAAMLRRYEILTTERYASWGVVVHELK